MSWEARHLSVLLVFLIDNWTLTAEATGWINILIVHWHETLDVLVHIVLVVGLVLRLVLEIFQLLVVCGSNCLIKGVWIMFLELYERLVDGGNISILALYHISKAFASYTSG